MTENIKERLRPVYKELSGLYASSPTPNKSITISDPAFWEYYHGIIDEISEITGGDFSRFKMTPVRSSDDQWIVTITYHQKLSGLISRLYGEFFSTELNPLTSAPSTQTTINQFQSQTQNLIIDFKNVIEGQIQNSKDDNEKNFLNTLKSKIEGVQNVTQLIKMILQTARDFGVELSNLISMFS